MNSLGNRKWIQSLKLELMGNLFAAKGGNSDEIQKSILKNSTGESKLLMDASAKD